jgi:UDP-N-acetylglucosamine:LPS N-acetylglucosamine transferase
VRSLRSTGRDVHLVLDPLRLAASVPQALWLLARRRPEAVFTTGGYVAIPAMLAARLLRIPVVLWDGNVVPGRSVRATARLAGAVAVSDPRTCAALAARRCYETGTPIRDPRSIDHEAAREQLGLAPRERLLLVFGGSQAVRRFNAAVAEALPRLVERCTVLHVTGNDGYADALATREGLVPLICVPYPHAGGHQRANAEAYAATGAARLVEDADFDAATLLEASRLLEDPAAHLAMSAAARSAGRPGAADAVAALVVAAAERRPWPAPAEIAALAVGGGPR